MKSTQIALALPGRFLPESGIEPMNGGGSQAFKENPPGGFSEKDPAWK
jgi:hypothetical protein